MSGTSSSKFWHHYDKLYADKDYAGEVKLISSRFKPNSRILDLGCGTGEHTRNLVSLGFTVVGVDIDQDAIKIAATKNINASFYCGDISEISCKPFDGVVSLFNVINYVRTLPELRRFFDAVFERMNKGSKFIFDCWNGEAVFDSPPLPKVSKFGRLTPTFDRGSSNVRLDCVYNISGETFSHSYDHHEWMSDEIATLLSSSGFVSIMKLKAMDFSKQASLNDWKIMFEARR